MSLPFKLFRLQQTDSQLDQIHARLSEIANQLNDLTALHEVEAQFESSTTRLKEVRSRLQKAEQCVKDQSIKIELTEASLYGGKVQNPKELQDLQNEAVALRNFLSVLEDRQLEAMLLVDEAEQIHAAVNAKLNQVKEETTALNSRLLKEQAQLEKEHARLSEERLVAIAGTPTENLELYDSLRKQRRGLAVAQVADNACSACGTTLNASLLQAARALTQIVRCSSCGRILYGG
ncbi:MAG: C4-type zinc ribbon domain-containing protein [Anaerolineales bacterium]|nr:C4-type zinc ribbon domain-containing protein [Anaerolineales bacterium]